MHQLADIYNQIVFMVSALRGAQSTATLKSFKCRRTHFLEPTTAFLKHYYANARTRAISPTGSADFPLAVLEILTRTHNRV